MFKVDFTKEDMSFIDCVFPMGNLFYNGVYSSDKVNLLFFSMITLYMRTNTFLDNLSLSLQNRNKC